MIGRVVLSLLGILLLVWGLGTPLVAMFGAEAEGRVTHVRRQGGERGEAVPNRYTYAIAYEFRLPDGTTAEGVTQRVGDAFSPRLSEDGRPLKVRYLRHFPRISTLGWRWENAIENLIVGAVGGLLIVLPWRRRKVAATRACRQA
ncbi:DUF3592 domain-containing protein [Blastochloris viridis]|uniref:DUF3592 domain-containing protein n=1 Tax=Blastochloris viridis TaxID=1079 RepID=A0A0H5B8J1_BLAVI|nr:DUF3592 domain-containing protein [Blastochloris viridis]ALK08220.1 hypothetical protein BVIR_422 [Blastochloris viridis]BAR98515.1 hypothetical protein BV133_922 [Blastochloris viridis]CUU44142.1 hypothetical protein BVIRIDIS_31890 [Blastochloris viridis]